MDSIDALSRYRCRERRLNKLKQFVFTIKCNRNEFDITCLHHIISILSTAHKCGALCIDAVRLSVCSSVARNAYGTQNSFLKS